MRQRRAASSARAQDQSQASAQSAQAPALQSGPAAPVQGDQTPMLDAVDGALGAMAADDIADVLARSARGEDVPPDELTSAQLGVGSQLQADALEVVAHAEAAVVPFGQVPLGMVLAESLRASQP